jgi:hypothetical protein
VLIFTASSAYFCKNQIHGYCETMFCFFTKVHFFSSLSSLLTPRVHTHTHTHNHTHTRAAVLVTGRALEKRLDAVSVCDSSSSSRSTSHIAAHSVPFTTTLISLSLLSLCILASLCPSPSLSFTLLSSPPLLSSPLRSAP